MVDQQVIAATQQLSQALEAMHQPGTSAEGLAAANSWLEKFQQTGQAWKVFHIYTMHALTCYHDRCMQCRARASISSHDMHHVQVCEDLLQSSDQPYAVLLYAAAALRNKIRKQLQTLSQDAWPGLRDTLASCINKHLSSNQPASIQLCIAMSALILQWSQWNDVLSYLGEATFQTCICYCTMRCATLRQAANAGRRLSSCGMLLLLEYLPQEPSDPVYGKLMPGGAAYEWEAQSQYRASHCCMFCHRTQWMLHAVCCRCCSAE